MPNQYTKAVKSINRGLTVKKTAAKKATTKKTSKSAYISAKISILGNGISQEFTFDKGATVKELLERAKIDMSEKEKLVEKSSGSQVYPDDTLDDGDHIVLTKKVESAN
jgi:hypothetical protein